ncbi:MAG: sugar ABC transporter substrate-binding protein [Oscillospiraceae bacterium]|nr:sugar ABC transporter substrate-binding protein [Oscillospiraceae bacterium]
MKKVLALLLCIVMLCTLVACANSDKPKETNDNQQTNENKENNEKENENVPDSSESDEYSIDVILKTTASEYWGYVVAGANAYAAENSNVKVDVKGPSSETAFDEQQNMIETDLASGSYDAFIIAPLQGDVVATLIAGQEKPVLAVDTNIEAPEILSFIGTGNKDAAAMGGQAAVAAAKEAGWSEIKAIAIAGVQGDTTAQARLDGYKEGVTAAGGEFLDSEIQWSNSVADQAVTCMEAIIQNHPEGVAIIVTHNDDTAMAAARAAKASGNANYEKTIFCGFDGIQSACEAILAGEETMSVAQEAYLMGYKAVEAAVAALKGETLPAFIDSGCSVVDKNNAQKRLDDLKGYLAQ